MGFKEAKAKCLQTEWQLRNVIWKIDHPSHFRRSAALFSFVDLSFDVLLLKWLRKRKVLRKEQALMNLSN